nr:basic salivary proline-rich protein 1-like [Globicephala melas]
MRATPSSPKQPSDDGREGGREEGNGCASQPHAEPSRRKREGPTPAPPGGCRGAGRFLHLLPPLGGQSGERSYGRREGTLGSGPERPAGRGPDHGRGAPAGVGGSLAALWAVGGGLRRESAPRATRAEGPPPALTCPLAPSRSGGGATLRRDPQSTSTKPQAVAAAVAAGQAGAGPLPETAPPPRPNPVPPAPGPAPEPPPPPPIGPRFSRMGAAPPHRPPTVPLGFLPSHWAGGLRGQSGLLGPRQIEVSGRQRGRETRSGRGSEAQERVREAGADRRAGCDAPMKGG